MSGHETSPRATPSREQVLDRIFATPNSFESERLVAAGIRSAASAIDRWEQIAPTRRGDLVRDQLAHPPLGRRRLAGASPAVRVGAVGSADDLLVLAWSAGELAQDRVAGARVLSGLGVGTGIRVANTLPGSLASPGALQLGDVIESMGNLDVPLGVIESEAAAKQAWALVDLVEPEVLVLDARSASRLLASAPGAVRPWWRGIVWLQTGGAAVSTASSPAGFSGWERTWFGVAEVGNFVGGSCARGSLHIDGGVLAEVVDPSGRSLRGETEGELTLTRLDLESPLLRFATGMRARQVDDCACGRGRAVVV